MIKERLFARDGRLAVERRGLELRRFDDLYHRIRSATWPRLLTAVALAWLWVALMFALGYLACGDAITGARPQSLADAFFFSVQTLSTIGYGGMSPVGISANLLVTLEALSGVLISAFITGLVFSKFATPTARVMFARHCLLTTHDGEPVFMFRMANQRYSQVLEAQVRVTYVDDHLTKEGKRFRRFVDLPLRRTHNPVFALGWTVMHPIDAGSPFYGCDLERLAERRMSVMVVVSGIEDTLATTVHARHVYEYTDLEADRDYADVVLHQPDGSRIIDYTAFHETLPREGSERA